MADTKEVAISGSVGKQVYSTAEQVTLKGVIATPGAASAVVVVVRDGETSGEVKLTVRSDAGKSRPFYLKDG